MNELKKKTKMNKVDKVNKKNKMHLVEQGVQSDCLPGHLVASLDAELERVLRGAGPDGGLKVGQQGAGRPGDVEGDQQVVDRGEAAVEGRDQVLQVADAFQTALLGRAEEAR